MDRGVHMKVLVLGGGVIGITTAYYLARGGAEGDRGRPAAGTGAGNQLRANAGQVSPGYSTPWAAPGIPLKGAQVAVPAPSPLAVRPDGSLYQWRWMAAMLRNCTSERYGVNKERMMRVAEYSRDCLRQLRARHRHRIRAAQRRHLQLFRTQAQLDAAARDIADAAGMRRARRAARPRRRGARRTDWRGRASGWSAYLRLPNDETGDCHRFTVALAGQARALGVPFRYGAAIEAIRTEGPRHGRAARRRGRRAAARRPLTCWRSAATRASCWRRSGWTCRSIRSRAIRSPSAAGPGAGAAVHRARRDLQDRADPLRRPHPRRRHGRARRLRPEAEPAPARDARNGHARPVPGRRSRACRVLDRPAADDARRYAVIGATACEGSTSTPGMARWAGPWRRARASCWPTRSWGASPPSTPKDWRWSATGHRPGRAPAPLDHGRHGLNKARPGQASSTRLRPAALARYRAWSRRLNQLSGVSPGGLGGWHGMRQQHHELLAAPAGPAHPRCADGAG